MTCGPVRIRFASAHHSMYGRDLPRGGEPPIVDCMRRDRSLIGALAIAVVVAMAGFPLVGWQGSLPLGATAFYVVALVTSGCGIGRAAVWGALTGVLFVVGVLASGVLRDVLYSAGALSFFAGMAAQVGMRSSR